MKLVAETTPTEKGTYSVVGHTIAACSPCCGNTGVYGQDEKTVCRACGKEFSIVSTPSRREKATPISQIKVGGERKSGEGS